MSHHRPTHHQHLLFSPGQVTGSSMAKLFQPGEVAVNHVKVSLQVAMSKISPAPEVLLNAEMLYYLSSLYYLNNAQSDNIFRTHSVYSGIIEVNTAIGYLSFLGLQ